MILEIRKASLTYTSGNTCEAYLLGEPNSPRDGELVATIEAPAGRLGFRKDGPANQFQAWFRPEDRGGKMTALMITDEVREGPNREGFRLASGSLEGLPSWHAGISL
jgi:hypothetical protein